MSDFISCRVKWDVPFTRQNLLRLWQRVDELVAETFTTFSNYAQPPSQSLDVLSIANRCVETVGEIVEADGEASCEPVSFWTTPFEIGKSVIFVSRLPDAMLSVDFCRYTSSYTTEAFQLQHFFSDRAFERFGVQYNSQGETLRQRFSIVDSPPDDFDDKADRIVFPDREMLWSLIGRIAYSQFELTRDLFPVAATHVDEQFLAPDFMLH